VKYGLRLGVSLQRELQNGNVQIVEDFIHNYRACTIHISTLIILLIANYYGCMKSNVEKQIKSNLHTAAYL
jgi:hypothetical protein